MLWRKKKSFAKLRLGLEVKRCVECRRYERPCLVGEKPAIFHRWVHEEKALFRVDTFMRPEEVERAVQRFRADGVIPPGCGVEKQAACFALVEYPDGSVGKVSPELIHFLDRKEG